MYDNIKILKPLYVGYFLAKVFGIRSVVSTPVTKNNLYTIWAEKSKLYLMFINSRKKGKAGRNS